MSKKGRPANCEVALPWSNTGSHVSPETLILAGGGGFAAGNGAILQGKVVLLPWCHLCDAASAAVPPGLMSQEWP